MKKYYKFFKDALINIVSNSLLLAMSQLVIFPYLSRVNDVSYFGIIISVYGISNIIVNVMGNTLNNIRLLMDNRIQNKSNFLYQLLVTIMLSFIISFFIYSVYEDPHNSITIILASIFTVLSIIRTYGIVTFRINLQYTKIIVVNILLMLGYIIGIVLFVVFQQWPLIFIMGEVLAIIYLRKSTCIYSGPIIKDKELLQIRSEHIQLATSNTIPNVMSSLDRILLNPMLGPTQLSIYYAANTISKMLGLLVTPISNVMLSYIINLDNNKAKEYIKRIVVISIISAIPAYFLLESISPILIKILYPQVFRSALKINRIVSLTVIIGLLISVLNPFIMKFCKMKYYTWIQILYGITYLIAVVFLTLKFNLYGFCLATLFSNLFKWILMIILGTYYVKEN